MITLEQEAVMLPVADLYELKFEDGSTCAYTPDAAHAVEWLAIKGNTVVEYVTLDRYQSANG